MAHKNREPFHHFGETARGLAARRKRLAKPADRPLSGVAHALQRERPRHDGRASQSHPSEPRWLTGSLDAKRSAAHKSTERSAVLLRGNIRLSAVNVGSGAAKFRQRFQRTGHGVRGLVHQASIRGQRHVEIVPARSIGAGVRRVESNRHATAASRLRLSDAGALKGPTLVTASPQKRKKTPRRTPTLPKVPTGAVVSAAGDDGATPDVGERPGPTDPLASHRPVEGIPSAELSQRNTEGE